MDQEILESEFIQSFSHYGDAIFRFCLVKVSNIGLAEDMTQEVFTRYWQYLRAGKEMRNTRSLLYTIANNLAKDWYKKKKADSLDVYVEAGAEPSDTAADPETAAAYEEVLATIVDMNETDRTVLMLRHVEGLEPKDIADILQETPNVVSVRLNRATKRLREKLGV